MQRKLLFTLFLFANSFIVSAQQYDYRTYNWYFGNSNQGIWFNRFDAEPILIEDQATPFGIGAGSVVSRVPTGELFFYTDGELIYDASQSLIAGNISLQGNTNGNQPSAVSRIPGVLDDLRFFVFSNDADGSTPGTIRLVEVDMDQAGNATEVNQPNLGAVVGGLQSTGINTASEGFVVLDVPGSDGIFLITQNTSTFEVELYTVTSSAPFVNLEASVPLPVNVSASNFSYALNNSQDSVYIALSPQTSGFNVHLLSLSLADSVLSFERVLANTGNADGGDYAVYDSEFKINADGAYLFFSRYGNTGNSGGVFGIDLLQVGATVETVADSLDRSFGLQLGPDGNIYHLYQAVSGGDFELGRIVFPDTLVNNYFYEQEPLGDINFESRQFPGFSGIARYDTSAVLANIVSYSTSQSSPTVVGLNADPGVFEISLNVGGTPFPNNAVSEVLPQPSAVFLDGFLEGNPITVGGIANVILCDSVDLGQDTTICLGEELVLDASQIIPIAGAGNPINYKWNLPDSVGPNFSTMTVRDNGTYWVAIEFSNGCVAYDEIGVEVIGDTSQYRNVWYFGDGAGIDFNTNEPLLDGQSQAPAGVATVSDSLGNLVFYTDGDAVYDNRHRLVASNIGGNNQSAQSVEIVPFPGSSTLFYIFTTERVDFGPQGSDPRFTLRYTIYDHKKDSNNIAPDMIGIPLYDNCTERLAVQGFGGQPWIVTHEFGSNTFVAFPIRANGIGRPVLSTAGMVHGKDNQESGTGTMKFTLDMRRLAVAIQEGDNNYVEVLDFDAITGEVSNPLRISIPEPNFDVYGVEFTSSGNKVFTTLRSSVGGNSKLYEIQIYDSVNFALQEVDAFGEDLGGMSTGPDGNIYISANGQNFVYNLPSEQEDSVFFTGGLTPFQLVTGISGLGLPTFTLDNSNNVTDPDFLQPDDGCLGQPVSFTGVRSTSIDEFAWSFGDGSGVPRPAADTASHTYAAVGVYSVTLNITNRCGLDTTFTREVTISESPNQPTIPPIESFCDPTVPIVLDADTTNSPGLSFDWNTGDTTRTITVSGPGVFGVVITNSAGCISSDTTRVLDGRTPIDLGPDLTICQNNPLPPFNAGIPNHFYQWFVNGVPGVADTLNVYTFDTSVPTAPNSDELVVRLIDVVTGCISFDTVMIMVNPLPTVAIQPTPPSGCGASDGSIEITSDISGYTVNWYDPNNTLFATNVDLIDTLQDGIYRLEFIDNITGCRTEESVSLVPLVGDFDISSTFMPNCESSTVDVTLTYNPGPPTGNYSYSVIELSSSLVVNTGSANTESFTVATLGEGQFIIVVDDGVCTAQDTVDIPLSIRFSNVLLPPDIRSCDIPVTLEVTNLDGVPTTYAWFRDGNSIPGGQSTDVSDAGNYSVTLSSAGYCDTTLFTVVQINTPPDLIIRPQDDGCDGELVLFADATPRDGIFSYFWQVIGQGLSGTGQLFSISTPPQQQTINLTITDQNTSCEADTLQLFNVFEPVNVLITVDPAPCEDGNPVELTSDLQPPTADIFNYQWFNRGVLIEGAQNSTLTTTGDGNFTVDVERSGTPCVYQGSFDLLRAPVSPSGIEGGYIICNIEPADSVVIVDVSDFSYSIVTELISGQNIPEVQPGIYELEDEGIYEFDLVNQFMCTTIDTTIVTIDCKPSIFAPTGFRPGSGIAENANFRVFPLYVADFEIYIYNRWGELVYFSNDLDFMTNVGWNGVVNGELAPGGTFAYTMRYKSLTSPERGFFEQRGAVTLVR